MYQFHGWCTLRELGDEQDGDRQQLALDHVREFVESLKWANGFCELRPFNGMYFIHFGGFQNRPRQEASDLKKLFALIAREVTGSYGLMYWRDDEDLTPPGRDNWHVVVLARGIVIERFDPFLSPSVPFIEDDPSEFSDD